MKQIFSNEVISKAEELQKECKQFIDELSELYKKTGRGKNVTNHDMLHVYFLNKISEISLKLEELIKNK